MGMWMYFKLKSIIIFKFIFIAMEKKTKEQCANEDKYFSMFTDKFN